MEHEILIQPLVELEEYDNTQSIEDVVQSLKNSGYNAAFLNDIEQGLKTSSVLPMNIKPLKNEDLHQP